MIILVLKIIQLLSLRIFLCLTRKSFNLYKSLRLSLINDNEKIF